ncbi:MAG: hypothetical protein IJ143_05950 [Neisseriaceae bacterium]|nr:hypothetical protein [Neisseriaceae bacterium]
MKKLLFILPLIFCFSLSFARVAMVCDYDDQGNRGDCTCYENNVEVLCKCQYKDSCSSLTSSEQCFPCYQYDGGGCYDSFASACSSHGFDRNGSIQGHCFKVRYENGKAVENIIGGLVTFSYFGFNTDTTPDPYSCVSPTDPSSGGGDNSSNDPPQADQKKVCSGGECKCYNLTTGKEEPCIGGNNSSGGSNSSGDNGSGSGNTGTGTGNGSGDSGNGQGAGSESSPSAGNGTNSGAGGDNSGTGTGSNNGNNSGGGTHTGSSGNQHGGGGTGLGGGSTGGNNGSPNGSEDGSDNGHSMGDGLNDYDFGTLPTDNDLPDPKDIDDKKKKIDLGGFSVRGYLNTTAQCPAPTTVDLKLFGIMEIEYTYFCNIARILRAVVVAFAWLSALLIIARINRS